MPDFRPRPAHMVTSNQLGRPAHDLNATMSTSLSVKATSDAAVASELTSALGVDVNGQLDTIRQRLDDADIP